MRCLILCLLCGLLAAQDIPLSNADFSVWRDGLPVGWDVGRGAGPDGEPSGLEGGPGLALVGRASTRAWRLVSQSFEARPGAVYRLGFSARAADLRQEEGQFNSRYVGLVFYDAGGGVLARVVSEVAGPELWARSLVARAPENTARGEVAIFLSMTGRLEVRGVELAETRPEQSFALLVEQLDAYYSHFPAKELDWPAHVDSLRARSEAEGAAFGEVLAALLAPLADPHVWVRAPDGSFSVPHASAPEQNFDLQATLEQLVDVRQVVRNVIAARTAEGYGYLCLGTLALDDASFRAVDASLARMLAEVPAIVIDLRVNGGGDERRAAALVGRFTDRALPYAQAKVRDGPAPDAYLEPWTRSFGPVGEEPFSGPVVGLLGPGCLSSGEGMALMLAALPHVVLVGQPTRGASGNPAWVPLPNGYEVAFSRWVSLRLDGSSIEGEGIRPDVAVEHQAGSDRTLERARSVLRGQLDDE